MNSRVEKAAQTFAAKVARDYGVTSALARAKRLRREYKHDPQWLQRAIEILTEMEKNL